jgi:type IV secretory pathway TrbL component
MKNIDCENGVVTFIDINEIQRRFRTNISLILFYTVYIIILLLSCSQDKITSVHFTVKLFCVFLLIIIVFIYLFEIFQKK